MRLGSFRPAISAPASPQNLAILLSIGYCLFYGWLLARSGGFPYVMDNNESFSSLWHASNLYHFGFENVFGLTDEAYGFSPAAHPYVYTHQGNFPRIPAFFLYVLGARSIESQIVATTFTVGLAALLLAYWFLATLTGNWKFAALTCLIIYSDYLLVAQWQVVTYRVWHAFFFFSTLQCAHAVEGQKPGRASLVLLLNTIFLFYFELVFAAFIASFAGLYALFRNFHNKRVVARVWLALLVAGVIGAGTLCLQNILYMGWDNFIKDLTYTYVARNQFTDSESMVRALRTFFDSNHIVFWYNLFDASGFRTPMHLGASIVYYELQPHTPYFILLLMLPVVGYLAMQFRVSSSAFAQLRYAENLVKHPFARIGIPATRYFSLVVALILPALLVGIHLFYIASVREVDGILVMGLVLGLLAILYAASCARSGVTSVEGSMSMAGASLLFFAFPSVFKHSYWMLADSEYSSLPVMTFATSYVLLLSLNLHLGTLRLPENRQPNRSGKWFKAPLFLITCLVLAVLLIGSPFALGWRPKGSWLRGEDVLLGSVLTLLMFVAIARFSERRDSGLRSWLFPGAAGLAVMDRAWRFNIVLIGIFVVQSLLFNQTYQPIWKALGHEMLSEPMRRVFMLFSVLLAHAFHQVVLDRDGRFLPKIGVFLLAGYLAYIFVYMLSPGYVFTGYRFRLTPFSIFITDVAIACGIWLAIRGVMAVAERLHIHSIFGVAAGMLPVFVWIQLQSAQISMMPPEQFSELRSVLSNTPYRGASFVSNMYAAPVAAFTGQWAYIDPELAEAKIYESDGRKRLKTDSRYLWFADRAENPEYAKPQYFLCLLPQSLPSLVAKISKDNGDGSGYRGCSEMGIVRFARSNQKDVLPRAELISIDSEGKGRYGYETWAIVKLDWAP